MIMQADEMLYNAKESGKNQFIGIAFDRKHEPSLEAAAHYQRHHETDRQDQRGFHNNFFVPLILCGC